MKNVRIRSISVRSKACGWGVHIDDGAGALTFETGAQAEAAARKLAARYAALGEAAEIQIYLRDGSLAARLQAAPWALAARPAPIAA